MNLLKFINLFYKIKSLFSCLPKGIQEEILEDMNGYSICVRLLKLKN